MRSLNSLNLAVKIFLLFIFSINLSISQPLIEWEKSYGGSGDDFARSLIQTSEGGYIIAGETTSNDGDISTNKGERDGWIVKLNNLGEIEWEKTYGGTSVDRATSILQSQNGGYLVGCNALSNNGDIGTSDNNKNGWILKLDLQGEIEWEKSYGGTYHITSDMKQMLNGDYMIVGRSVQNNDFSKTAWVLKLKEDGNIIWEEYYGSNNDRFNSVEITPDGGCILVGESYSMGDTYGNNRNSDFWVVKLDRLGKIEWEQTYGGTEDDVANDILLQSDGSYMVIGSAGSNDGDVLQNNGWLDYWILKLNPQGEIIWQKSYGGSNSDEAHGLEKTDDSGYVIAGFTTSADGDVSDNHKLEDIWLIKLDSLGNLVWENTYGTNSDDFLYSFSKTLDGGYILPGMSWDPDMRILDYLIIKLAPVMVNIEQSNFDFDINIFPNPSFGELHIYVNNLLEPFSVEVYDITSKKVFKKKEVTSPITLNNLPLGQYIINVETFERNYIKKIIVH